jgi:MFS family permease
VIGTPPAAAWVNASAPTPWRVFGIASIAVFLVSIDTTVLFAAFGALRAGFPDSTAADLSWVLNAYTVVYAALLVPAGRLSDAHGRKRIFQLGLVLFLAASAACGAAPSVGALVQRLWTTAAHRYDQLPPDTEATSDIMLPDRSRHHLS